jgi:hypothetical protein
VSEYRRRRRLEPEPERRGLPLLPLLLVVIFAGLLLGGLLAKFFGRAPAPAPKVAALPSPIPSITPIITSAPSLAASPGSQPSVVPSASPSPSATPSTRPVRTPRPSPSAPVIVVTPPPKPETTSDRGADQNTPQPQGTGSNVATAPTAAPLVTAAPQSNSEPAVALVRSYLHALARGDQPTATDYLVSGLPNETYMTSAAKINSVDGVKNSDGSYKVTADVSTAEGEYFETFTVKNGPYGLQISDHYTIKVQ